MRTVKPITEDMTFDEVIERAKFNQQVEHENLMKHVRKQLLLITVLIVAMLAYAKWGMPAVYKYLTGREYAESIRTP